MENLFLSVLDKIYSQNKVKLLSCNMPNRTSHEVYFVEFSTDVSSERQFLVFKLFPTNIPGYKNPCLKKEVEVLNGLKDSGVVDVPTVVYYDPSDTTFEREFFVLEGLKGTPMSKLISGTSDIDYQRKFVQQSAELIARIHSANFNYFPSLNKEDYALKTISNFNRLYSELKESPCNISLEEMELMARTITLLDNRRPTETDFALINGDLSTNHFFLSNGKYYIIDWDPAEIGDRSWDLYWMIKEIPVLVFGYENAFDDLINHYESSAKITLRNKEFYSQAALAWAYILGWYIEERIPQHEVVPLIRACRLTFKNKLEQLISK